MQVKTVITSLTIGAVLVIGCNEAKEEKTTTTEPATTLSSRSQLNTRRVIVEEDVPQPIVTNFKTKYPAASNVEWRRYTAVDTIYLNDKPLLDTNFYYAEYRMNDGSIYTSLYDLNGEWVKTSTLMKGNPKLPDAVNKAINDNYPGFTIEEVSKENDKDMEMYEVKMNKGDQKVKVKYLPDGTVFKLKIK